MAEGPATAPGLRRLPRWKRALPVAFIVASLLALVILPVISTRRSNAIRNDIRQVAEPARSRANQIQLSLLRENAQIVAFQVTEQDQYRDRLVELAQGRREAYEALDPLVRQINSRAVQQLRELRSCTSQWEASIVRSELLARDLPAPIFLQRLYEIQPGYESCQAAAEALKNTIGGRIDRKWVQLGEIDQTQTTIAVVLTLLALASAGLVVWLGRQTRMLATVAQTEREAAERQAERAELARLRAEGAERRSAFLAELSRELSASLDLQSMLQTFARLVAGSLADLCLVDLAENGTSTRIALAHADPDNEELWKELSPMDPDLPDSPLKAALESGNPQIATHVWEEMLDRFVPAESLDQARRLGVRSWIVVPLRSRERTLGAATLVLTEPDQHFDSDDLELAMRVASRTALAMDNALLYLESQQNLRAREEILAIVSHDLRNPLTTIQMTASLLLESAEEPIREDLEIVRSNARRMNRLIQDLLDVSTLDRGRQLSMSPEPLEVPSLLREACEMFRSQAAADGKELESRIETVSEFSADRDRLLQVFSNLIGNAMKFTRPGDRIMVRATPQNDQILFAVEDSGPGIPAEDVHRIFEPFWQARRTARLGAGLGLTISKGIVEAHGGRIWAESEPGRGTTFFFTIPQSAAPPAGE